MRINSILGAKWNPEHRVALRGFKGGRRAPPFLCRFNFRRRRGLDIPAQVTPIRDLVMRVNTSRGSVRDLSIRDRTQGVPVTDLTGEGSVKCTNARELHMFGYPDEIAVGLGIEPNRAVSQRCFVRCRKCPECLRHRARLWTARAIDETKVSRRTWFGTLTLAPDRQTWARYSAQTTMERGGWPLEELTEERVFRKSVDLIGQEITRFLKRLRKRTPFRYLLVTEQHKSGLPHFHCLVHEYEGALTKRDLEAQWRYGFSHWRLLEPGEEGKCGYVAKYLAKSALTRVRASEDYGQGAMRPLTERVLQATRATSEALVAEKNACLKRGDQRE